MNSSNNDLFAYRSRGGHFNVGSGTGDNMSAFVKVDDQLMCITRKNIRVVLLADDVDPERTNPSLSHNTQHILPYGSDDEFVGRTFQQANILFEEHSLSANIDCNKGISISLSFLKEITALDKLRTKYLEQEKSINSSANKNSHVPAFPNLEQEVKGFILNTDHAMRLIMELVQLFYPSIKNKGWEVQLYQITKSKLGEQDPSSGFILDFKDFTERTRKIRNTVEHPDADNVLTIENYKLTPANIVELPSISFIGKEHNLPKIGVPVFMDSTVFNLLTIFELLMAYLCNLHAKPFAGDKRIVVSVPEDKRRESEKHVGFQYQILWTK